MSNVRHLPTAPTAEERVPAELRERIAALIEEGRALGEQVQAFARRLWQVEGDYDDLGFAVRIHDGFEWLFDYDLMNECGFEELKSIGQAMFARLEAAGIGSVAPEGRRRFALLGLDGFGIDE